MFMDPSNTITANCSFLFLIHVKIKLFHSEIHWICNNLPPFLLWFTMYILFVLTLWVTKSYINRRKVVATRGKAGWRKWNVFFITHFYYHDHTCCNRIKKNVKKKLSQKRQRVGSPFISGHIPAGEWCSIWQCNSYATNKSWIIASSQYNQMHNKRSGHTQYPGFDAFIRNLTKPLAGNVTVSLIAGGCVAFANAVLRSFSCCRLPISMTWNEYPCMCIGWLTSSSSVVSSITKNSYTSSSSSSMRCGQW